MCILSEVTLRRIAYKLSSSIHWPQTTRLTHTLTPAHTTATMVLILSKLAQLKLAVEAQSSLLTKTYSEETQAEALLFYINVHGTKALRIEAQYIGKELTDGLYIGKDPAGTLHYNDINDLKDGREVTYLVKRKQYDGKNYLWIGCYTTNSENYHAEFIAVDSADVVTTSGMDGYTHTATWKDLTMASATASVDKRSDESDIIVTIKSLKKKAKIPAPSDLSSASFHMEGTMWYKKLSDIPDGVNANFDRDSIVFMKSWYTSTDWTSFFIPYTAQEISITSAITLKNITWSDT